MTINTTYWAWPQITALILILIALLIGAVGHGKPKKGEQSFPVTLFSSVLWMAILIFGGFFK
ncbi:MAG: hypothetical protein ACRYF5_06110 [Janthinobacterium lividum]